MNSKTKRLRFLRTAVGAPVAPFVIKQLKEAGHFVVGVDCEELACGYFFCDRYYVVPRVKHPDYISTIKRICEQESIDVLWPDLEEELLMTLSERAAFEALGVRILLSDYASVATSLNKFSTFKFLKQHQLPIPDTFQLSPNVNVTLKFPFLIKPEEGRGSRNVFIVTDQRDLTDRLKEIKEPMIAQKMLRGREFTIDTLSDFEGTFLYASIRERLQTESGISVKGRTVKNDKLVALVGKVCNLLKLKGPACLQYMEDEHGEEGGFIEINPRIAGTVSLSVLAGAPIIHDIVRMLLGEAPIGPTNYQFDFKMARYWSEAPMLK